MVCLHLQSTETAGVNGPFWGGKHAPILNKMLTLNVICNVSVLAVEKGYQYLQSK